MVPGGLRRMCAVNWGHCEVKCGVGVGKLNVREECEKSV